MDFEGFKYERINSNEICINSCISSDSVVCIPAMIDGLPVTSIGEEAFNGCRNLETIYISDFALSREAILRNINELLQENSTCKIISL